MPESRSFLTEDHGLFVEVYEAVTPQRDETLLLVHGAGCGSWYWERAAPALAAEGWTSAALNLRGHHRSNPMEESELSRVSIFDYVDDMDEVLDALPGPFIVVAHSIGGLVALKHAEIGRHQPEALALYAPSPPRGAGECNFPSLAPDIVVPPFDRAAARFWFFYDISEADLSRYAGLLGPESSNVLNAGGHPTIDVDPARVSGPVCVISSAEDVIQGPNGGLDRSIANRFGAEYRLVRQHGHLVLVENNWNEGLQPLLRWLRCQFP